MIEFAIDTDAFVALISLLAMLFSGAILLGGWAEHEDWGFPYVVAAILGFGGAFFFLMSVGIIIFGDMVSVS